MGPYKFNYPDSHGKLSMVSGAFYGLPQIIINVMHENRVRQVNIVQFRVRITGVLARPIASGLKRRNCVPRPRRVRLHHPNY